MAQDPNDPKVQAYYTKQRMDAVKANNIPEMEKIASKLSPSRRATYLPEEMATGAARLKPGASEGEQMTNVAGILGGGADLANLAKAVMSHPAMVEHVVQQVGPSIGNAVKGMLKGFFPDAGESLGATAAKKGISKIGRPALQKAEATAPKALQKAQRGSKLMKNVTPRKLNVRGDSGKPKIAPQKVIKQRALSSDIGKKVAKKTSPKTVTAVAKTSVQKQAERLGLKAGKPKTLTSKARTGRPKAKKAPSPTSDLGHNLSDLPREAANDVRGLAKSLPGTRGKVTTVDTGEEAPTLKGATRTPGRPYTNADIAHAVKMLKSHGINASKAQAENFLSEAIHS